jgi:hypothetical protein
MNDNDIRKAYEGLTPNQQLNLFRNLYYNDGYATERGIIANAINHILPKIIRQKAEIERLNVELQAMRGAANSYKMHYNQAIKEFAERLKESAFDCDVSFGYGREHYTEAVAVVEIDNLVKEMTEGRNDNTI